MATQEDLTAEGLEVPPKSDEPAKKQHIASREFEEVPQIVEHCSKSVNFTPFGTHARDFPGSFLILTATCLDATDTRWVPCSAKFVLLGINPRGTGAFKIYELNHGTMDLVAEARFSPLSVSHPHIDSMHNLLFRRACSICGD